jgi:hypothetical protein
MDLNCNFKLMFCLIIIFFVVYLLRSKILYVFSVLGESAQHFSTQYNSSYIDSDDDEEEEKPIEEELDNNQNKKTK